VKGPLIALGIAAVLVGGVLALWTLTAGDDAPPGPPPGIRLRHRQPGGELRLQVQRLIQTEVAPIQTEAQLDRYLAELEARVHAKRAVTPLEVQPGLRAIEQLRPTLGNERADAKQRAFSELMKRLTNEYKGSAPPPPRL
jgi:hypothetical protein